MSFDHNKIEKKWQAEWENSRSFEVKIDPNKKKFYALDMFPYPSGAGLHVGHLASYTPTEIVSRYKRACGFNVLHPIGYDAFGLPAEQYAIQTGVHPAETTMKAIKNFKRQLKSFGYSFDWSREICTCDPDYYKWTQKIFLLLFKRGLAYKKEAPVNWCPALRTTLANEEVVNGKSERGGYPVVQKYIQQWILKITAYADRLLNDLKDVNWPQRTVEGQKNWIGKSYGLLMEFPIKNSKNKISIFTTRPDTLFGSTFMVLSPEHPLIREEFSGNKEFSEIVKYQKKCQSMSAVEKQQNLSSTGVFSGSYAVHPLNGEEIPIWIADYVLMEYGTGAIMSVPAHDERDFIFAKKFNLPIKVVVRAENSKEGADSLPFVEEGVSCNSEFLNGLSTKQAIQKMNDYIKEKKLGVPKVQYKLRDWIFSRQRYWGEPFPIAYLNEKPQAVEELPVTLPETAHYEPSEKGEPPLARVKNFVEYTDSKGNKLRRETDTMPGTAASAWYFLRYTDPHNTKEPFSFSAQKYWMPVDLYVGGPEHTVSHLFYSRFWQKVLYDAGWVSHKEPFQKLVHQGSILGADGFRMSKSRGNTVNPDDIREKYGADAIRLYIAFLGPFEKDKPWADKGIDGCRRFLDRLWRLCFDEKNNLITEKEEVPKELNILLHQTIQKVTEDIEKMSFNTAISAMMILVNEMYLKKSRNHKILKTLVQLLQPFAPHISEEIWSRFGEKTLVSLAPWPVFDPQMVQKNIVTMGVQINGKVRSTIDISQTADEQEALALAKKSEKIEKILKSSQIKQVIYKPGRILNIVCQ
ncbi:MAG: leucine--tRNA ligase [Bdellovibrionales bacterium]|nr:leucine--tRNA ligase [Bdellovibrionales bacterium]